jgi:hypothetical protein
MEALRCHFQGRPAVMRAPISDPGVPSRHPRRTKNELGGAKRCTTKRMIGGPLGLFLFVAEVATAQSTYKLPPPEVVRIIDAPLTPTVLVSPTRDALLLVSPESYPPIRQ